MVYYLITCHFVDIFVVENSELDGLCPRPSMYSVSTLLKVVGYYDLSVLSMTVMGFQKKSLGGVGGWGEFYPIFFWDFFNFAKPLIVAVNSDLSKQLLKR